jgi:hypothetical protein
VGAVAGSGVVSTGRLTAYAGTVEIASTSLPLGGSSDVRSGWYDDGRLLADRLAGPVTVAAAGPVVRSTVRGRRAARPVEARSYEVRRLGESSLGTVVRVGGRAACVGTVRLRPVAEPVLRRASVLRCVPPGARDGVLHVVAGPGVTAVRVRLLPAGRRQRERVLLVRPATPGARPAGDGFAVLVRVPGLPTGRGSLEAFDARRRLVARTLFGPYAGPQV